MYLVSPIVYLESKDFTNSCYLKHFKIKTCVIMIQANYCGHCTSAKPLFQKFADKHKDNKDVLCLTIQGDGDDAKDTEKMLAIVSKLKPGFQGFPDYLLFKKGKYVEKEIKGRNEASLEEFIK